MPNAFKRGEAYPVRTWLLSWNRAIQIQKYSALEPMLLCKCMPLHVRLEPASYILCRA